MGSAREDGDLYFYEEVASIPPENVWTVSEGEELDESGFNVDGNWYASPGIFFANALGYLIAGKPWVADTPDAIWYLDDDEQAREERRKDFLEQ